jgi:5-formyltetrahydrofolate cyclo-ligase
MTIGDDKAELRTFVRLTRAARTASERATAELGYTDVLALLADQFSWSRIAAFIPTPSEPPIARGLDELVRHGVTVLVPVSSPSGLLEWATLEPGAINSTIPDAMNMPIPASGERVTAEGLDAVLVPAAAVDRDGNRLGWGKGYFDRFLESVDGSPLVIAVVFESDIVDAVPVEAHDIAVGAVATDSEVLFTQ